MTDAAPGAAPAPQGEPEPGPSPFAALAGTFTSPAATFAGLVRRPTWWLPLLLWLAGIAVVILVSTPKVDMERTMREMFEKRAERTGQSMSDEQIREMAARSNRTPAKAVAWGVPTSVLMFLFVDPPPLGRSPGLGVRGPLLAGRSRSGGTRTSRTSSGSSSRYRSWRRSPTPRRRSSRSRER